jgi:hypothetical protein
MVYNGSQQQQFFKWIFSHPKLMGKLTTFLHFKCQFSKEISYNPLGKLFSIPKFP